MNTSDAPDMNTVGTNPMGTNPALTPIRPTGMAMALLAAGALLTAFWVGLNLLLPDLQATGIPSSLIRLILHGLMLTGLWLALARSDFAPAARVRTWLAIALPFTAWLAIVWWQAAVGGFRPGPGLPAIPLAIVLPLIIAIPVLLKSRTIGRLLDAMPPWWLIALQVYRVIGGIFLVAWYRGNLSGVFAIPAGTGDILVGLLALPVAYLLYARTPGSRRAAIAWNGLGLIDFTVAVGIGMLSSPGPLQLIVPDPPNVQLGTFPTVMIPAFAVPSSILLHVLSLRQLHCMAHRRQAL